MLQFICDCVRVVKLLKLRVLNKRSFHCCNNKQLFILMTYKIIEYILYNCLFY